MNNKDLPLLSSLYKRVTENYPKPNVLHIDRVTLKVLVEECIKYCGIDCSSIIRILGMRVEIVEGERFEAVYVGVEC